MSVEAAPAAPEVAQVPVASDVPAVEKTAPPIEGASEDQPADQNPAEGDESKPKPRQKAQERISELYGRTKAAERERDAALAELARLRKPVVDPQQWDQLSFDQQQAAQMRHAVREERAQEVAQAAHAREIEAEVARGEMFNARLESFVERVPDATVLVTDKSLPVTELGARFIAESEKGPEVAWWLHQNRKEALRIARLEPVAQAFELGRIEARIASTPVTRKVSQAPHPTPKVGGGASAGAKDPASMSDEEYSNWYKARQRR